MKIIKNIKKAFIKGKYYTQQAAKYLDEKAKIANKYVKRGTDRLDKYTENIPDKTQASFERFSKKAVKFKENLNKELAPIKRYQQRTQANLLFTVGQTKKITIISRRPTGVILRNSFSDPIEAVNYINRSREIGNKILKVIE